MLLAAAIGLHHRTFAFSSSEVYFTCSSFLFIHIFDYFAFLFQIKMATKLVIAVILFCAVSAYAKQGKSLFASS